MKRIILLWTLLMFQYASSGQLWDAMNSGTTSNLWDIYFLSNTTGYACGVNGTLLKTIDGGTTWTSKNITTTKTFNFLQFVNVNVGYMGGYLDAGGCFFKTTDGGNTWNEINLNSPGSHCGGPWIFSADTFLMAFGDNNFANSQIKMTVNGGTTWTTVYTGGTGWISFMYFPDRNNGYATVSNSKVLKTTNGGLSWTLISNIGGTSNLWMSGVYFFNKDSGFVGGGNYPSGGSIFKTSDGGTSWQTVSSVYSSSRMLFTDKWNGYNIEGNKKDIIVSTDGGNSWSVETTLAADTLHGIHFSLGGIGYAVGNHGIILRYGTPSGVSDKSGQADDHVSISPNPCTNTLNIEMNLQGNIRPEFVLFNMLGRVLIKVEVGQEKQMIDAGLLPDGIYFYQVHSTSGIIKSGKLIVE